MHAADYVLLALIGVLVLASGLLYLAGFRGD